MSYITTTNLTSIMAEMTDFCNAACPMCNRFDWDLKLVKGITNAHHTTLQFVKDRIGDEIISRLGGWTCQGTYGDASMNPETVEIFKYLREINPNIEINMYTNGGARSKGFWKALADLNVIITFGIDGLEDTNHLYRRNVRWDRLMQNTKAFIDAGGDARWKFIIFKHNEHQVLDARTLANKMGFKLFELWLQIDLQIDTTQISFLFSIKIVIYNTSMNKEICFLRSWTIITKLST